MRYGAISLADSGSITFQANGAISSLGTSGTLTLTSGSGGTVSAGGVLKLQSGSGGSTSGKGGDLQLFAGPAAGSTGGAGGDVSLLAGAAAGSTGGVGGSISLTAGAALIGNQAGGGVTLTGGAPSGTGTSGAVTLIGANNTSSVGGNVVLRGGRGSAALNDGVVQIDRTSVDNRASRLRFVGDNAGTVDLKAGSSVTSYALTLPTAQGASNSCLSNDGAGVTSWSTTGFNKFLQSQFTQITVDTTTGSVTFVPFLSQSITISSTTNFLIVHFSAGASNLTNNNNVIFRLTIDGAAIRGAAITSSPATAPQSSSIVYRTTGLSVGAHTVAIQWRVNSSTGRVRPVTAPDTEHASLLVEEVSA